MEDTVKVRIIRPWFTRGKRYRCFAGRPTVHDIPVDVVFDAEGKSLLPKSATIVDADYVEPEPEMQKEPRTLGELNAQQSDHDAVQARIKALAGETEEPEEEDDEPEDDEEETDPPEETAVEDEELWVHDAGGMYVNSKTGERRRGKPKE